MDTQTHRPTGFLLLALGAFLGIVAWVDKTMLDKDRWPMTAAAATFSICGLQLAIAAKGRWPYVFGGVIFTIFSYLGFVGAFSDRPLSGGIPFIPTSWNQSFGHILFGLGALITAACAMYCFRKAIKSEKRLL
jgi:hypothetical protein